MCLVTSLNGHSIERVSEYKYLDIWLDQKVVFKFHIDILKQATTKNWMLSRKRIIEAVFLSVLDYGDVIDRHASASTLKPLDSVYHSALRFITGDSYSTHHCIFYEKIGWASPTVRRDRHLFLFIYKTLMVTYHHTSIPSEIGPKVII